MRCKLLNNLINLLNYESRNMLNWVTVTKNYAAMFPKCII